MYSRVFAHIFLVGVLSLVDLPGVAQSVVIENLFDSVPGRGRTVSKSMVVNPTAADKLDQNFERAALRSFPLADGSRAGFELTPVDVFRPGMSMTVVGENGSTSSVALPTGRTWRGVESSGGERSLFLTERSDGTLAAVVTGGSDAADTVVLPDGGTGEYTVVAAEMPATADLCSVGTLVDGGSVRGTDEHDHSAEEAQTGTSAAAGAIQAEIMLDVSYETYLKLGSNSARVADYVAQLMGAVGTVYRRDLNVELVVSHLYVWTTPDVFNSNLGADGKLDSGDQLANYRNYIIANRAGLSRDLAHLINYNPYLGGIAYVDALGKDAYGLGVSNVYAELNFPTNINSYYWDTMVVAHEIGHNFGSQHTHCYNPPIDCCVTQANCSDCATAAPSMGTIMSYCHLQSGKGGGITMNFHERTIELLRQKIASSPVLMPYITGPHMSVAGDTLKEIAAGDATPDLADGSDFSSVQQGSSVLHKYFAVANTGSQELVLTGAVAVTGSPQFSISQQPSVSRLTPGAYSSFMVAFDPSVPGLHEAWVTLSSNDPAAPQYWFAIKAEAAQAGQAKIFMYRGSTLIPDGNSKGVVIPIPVTGVSGSILDINVSIDGTDPTDPAKVGLKHAFVGDLKMILESPSGTRVTLMERPGGGAFGAGGRNFCGTIFDDESGGPSIQAITSSGSGQMAPPYTGRFTAAQQLSAFYGEPADGTWKLHTSDLQSPDPGVLQSFSLTITGTSQGTSSSVSDWAAY